MTKSEKEKRSRTKVLPGYNIEDKNGKTER